MKGLNNKIYYNNLVYKYDSDGTSHFIGLSNLMYLSKDIKNSIRKWEDANQTQKRVKVY